MAFYDARSDEQRDLRRSFRQARNVGNIGQDSTLDARLGNMQLTPGDGSVNPNAATRQDLRGQYRDLRAAGQFQPMGDPNRQQVKAGEVGNYRGQLMDYFSQHYAPGQAELANQLSGQNPGLMPALPQAPWWMSQQRATGIQNRLLGRYNQGRPLDTMSTDAEGTQAPLSGNSKGQPA